MIKKVLWVVPPVALDTNVSGAASRYLQNLRMLHELGVQVTGVRVGHTSELDAVEIDSGHGTALVHQWHEIHLPYLQKRSRFTMLRQTLLDVVRWEYPQSEAVGAALTRLSNEVIPDLIWVEGIDLAAAAKHVPSRKCLYSEHDIAHQVRSIRMGARQSLKERWLLWACQRAEQRILKATSQILTGSSSDAQKLRQMGAKQVTVIPITYDPIPPSSAPFAQTPRIVHLGSLETTANRVGLEGYLRKAHPAVQRESDLALTIVGDASRVKPPLSDLLRQAGATLVGYAPDLNTALRPGDLAILPYEHDTGYRTKLPLLLAYGQVVISTRAAVAGSMLPGLEDVCLIVDQVEEFPKVLIPLAKDESRRMSLSSAARRFFEAHFTHPCVLDSYRNLLKDLL